MDKIVKLSIIIPVYNCARSIGKTLDSILNQTLSSFEIICIDDGSTDGSSRVIQNYSQRDDRIIYIYQENSGAGIARNKGLSIANGEFIAFIDADDWYVDSRALEMLVQRADSENLNIVGGNFLVSLRGKLVDFGKNDKFLRYIDEEIYLDYKDYQQCFYYQRFIFRKAFLFDNDILFPPYRRFQDPPFLVKALIKNKEFLLLPIDLYCYRGGYKTISWTTTKAIDWLSGVGDVMNLAADYDLDSLYLEMLRELDSDVLVILLYDDIKKKQYSLLYKLITLLNEINSHEKYANHTLRVLNDTLGCVSSFSKKIKVKKIFFLRNIKILMKKIWNTVIEQYE